LSIRDLFVVVIITNSIQILELMSRIGSENRSTQYQSIK